MTKVVDMTDEQLIIQARRMKASKYPNHQISETLQITPRSVTNIFEGGNWAWSAKQLASKIVLVRGWNYNFDY